MERRQPAYLSPTSLQMFYEDRPKFYLQYLCPTKLPRDPQTSPMAVGSAFDAFVKSFLVEKLIGKRDQFEFTTLFEAQVEAHNRDEALTAGRQVFEAYKAQGALGDILADLSECIGEPRFEASLEGTVRAVSVAVGDIPFLGKPDIFFITKHGGRVIFDWKVNGYYSNKGPSPASGYVRIRTKNPKTNGQQYGKALVMPMSGVMCSINYPLCDVDKKWAGQTAVYAWLLGEEVGSQFITAIDQIVVGKDALGMREFRIAQHRSTVTEKFQRTLFKQAHTAWHAVKSGHVFFEQPREESDRLCLMLDTHAAQRAGGGSALVDR